MTDPIDDHEHRMLALEAWKKVVQTQEHFNEICMKVRTLYATVIAVVLSVYGAFLKEGGAEFHLGGIDVAPIVPILIAIIIVTRLFYFVDRHWYHRLLLGAVDQGTEIENRWQSIIPEIALGSKISARSPVELANKKGLAWSLGWFVTDKRFKEGKKLHSDAKIEVFYKPIAWLGGFLLVLAVLLGGIRIQTQSIACIGINLMKDVSIC